MRYFLLLLNIVKVNIVNIVIILLLLNIVKVNNWTHCCLLNLKENTAHIHSANASKWVAFIGCESWSPKQDNLLWMIPGVLVCWHWAVMSHGQIVLHVSPCVCCTEVMCMEVVCVVGYMYETCTLKGICSHGIPTQTIFKAAMWRALGIFSVLHHLEDSLPFTLLANAFLS